MTRYLLVINLTTQMCPTKQQLTTHKIIQGSLTSILYVAAMKCKDHLSMHWIIDAAEEAVLVVLAMCQ